VRTRSLGWAGLVALLFGCLLAVPARAVDASRPWVDLSRLEGGVSLVDATFLLEDASAAMSLLDVMQPGTVFMPVEQEASFGFTRSVVWVRFDVANPGGRMQPWLFEVAYSHLDYLELYAVHPDGHIESWKAGDMYPFAERQVAVPNFVFPQETESHARTTYYLRVQTAGTMRVPLRAWLALEFAEHESEQNLVLWLFYGVVAAMTLYNIGTALLLRSREYVYYLGLLISLGGAIFTLSGQTFQYLTPRSPLVANRALTTFMALGLTFTQLYGRELLRQVDHVPQLQLLERVFRWTFPLSLALVLPAAMFGPRTFAQIAVFIAIIAYVPVGVYAMHRAQKYASSELRSYLLSFYCLAITIPIALLAHARVFAPSSIAVWAGHIGCAGYSILTSLGLPTRINQMGKTLALLNDQLSENVIELTNALAKAEQATKVKDEFMATMSHELRTPLNAIINVPQGLLEDFPAQRSATCEACQAEFLLEDGETLQADTVCEECGRPGSLRPGQATVYVGEPARTARFLRKIERSGQHLLQMVNGVLDFSKMEAGRLDLAREAINLRVLLSDVVDQTVDLALKKQISIELKLAETGAPSHIDAMRIRQVMLNLLTNAIKFSDTGAQIFVAWRHDAEADTISVTDQGIGIAPEDQQRIFSSFEQVHKGDTRKYGGTGLGLSISRSLVRMHGGELWVESKLGAGATFIFTLPRRVSGSGALEAV